MTTAAGSDVALRAVHDAIRKPDQNTGDRREHRLRSEPSFAALCGVRPLEASWGYIAREIYQIITVPPEAEPSAA
jgi:hypothetical protein